MATIINNPSSGEGGSSAVAVIIGIVAVLVIGALFVFYGLPALNGNAAAPKADTIDVNVTLPQPTGANPAPAQEPAQN